MLEIPARPSTMEPSSVGVTLRHPVSSSWSTPCTPTCGRFRLTQPGSRAPQPSVLQNPEATPAPPPKHGLRKQFSKVRQALIVRYCGQTPRRIGPLGRSTAPMLAGTLRRIPKKSSSTRVRSVPGIPAAPRKDPGNGEKSSPSGFVKQGIQVQSTLPTRRRPGRAGGRTGVPPGP